MHPGSLIGLLLTAVAGIVAGGSSKDNTKKKTRKPEEARRPKATTPSQVSLESKMRSVIFSADRTLEATGKVWEDQKKQTEKDPNVDELYTKAFGLVYTVKSFEESFSNIYPQLLERYRATKHELKELKEAKDMISTKWKVGLSGVAVLLIFGLGVVSSPRLTELYDRFNQAEIILSEKAAQLSELLQSSYFGKLEVAKLKSQIDFNQDHLAFHQLVSDQASGLLHQAESDHDIKIGTGVYSQAEVQHDWELRQTIIFEVKEALKVDQRKLAQFEDLVLKWDQNIESKSAELIRLNRHPEVSEAELVALMSIDPTAQIKIIRFFNLEATLEQAREVFSYQLASAHDDFQLSKDSQQINYEIVGWQETAIPDSQWEKLPPIKSAQQQREEARVAELQRLEQEAMRKAESQKEKEQRLVQERATEQRRIAAQKAREQRLAQLVAKQKADAKKAEARRLIQEENDKLDAMGNVIFTGRVTGHSFYDTGIVMRGKGFKSDELHVTHTSGNHYAKDVEKRLIFVFAPEGSDNDFLSQRLKEAKYSGGLIKRQSYRRECGNHECVFVSSNPNKKYDHLYVMFNSKSTWGSVELKMTIKRLSYAFDY